jgi:hypothetical protein
MTSTADPKDKTSIAQAVRRFWEKSRKPLISVLIIYLVYCLWLMAWPFDKYFDARRKFLRPVGQLFAFVGLDVEYKLYAPDPPQSVSLFLFQVFFNDGTSTYWAFPRDKLAPWDPPGSFNRYVHMFLYWGTGKLYRKSRPDLARYIARENDSPNRHPIQIDFIEKAGLIPIPEQGIGKPLVQPTQDQKFFSYKVQERDLR